jgi:hypothetical protein
VVLGGWPDVDLAGRLLVLARNSPDCKRCQYRARLKRHRISHASTRRSIGGTTGTMIQEAEVRNRIAALASGQLSLVDFERWLGPASRNMHADSSPEAIDLVSSIHLLLSERDHGDLSNDELRQDLLNLVDKTGIIEVVLALDPTVSLVRARSASNAANFPEFFREVRVPA